MEIAVNGEKRQVEPGTRLHQFVNGEGKGWAIARNGEIVRRRDWASVEVAPGDEIEIVKAVQGG